MSAIRRMRPRAWALALVALVVLALLAWRMAAERRGRAVERQAEATARLEGRP